MADEIVEAAAHLQDVADNAVENAETNAAAEIEAAQQRVANAEAMAQQITDAALQTELGRQLSSLREEVLTWKTPLESQIQALQTTLGEIMVRLTTPAPQPAPRSSIPPASAEIIVPGDQAIPDDENEEGHAAPVVEKKRGRKVM